MKYRVTINGLCEYNEFKIYGQHRDNFINFKALLKNVIVDYVTLQYYGWYLAIPQEVFKT